MGPHGAWVVGLEPASPGTSRRWVDEHRVGRLIRAHPLVPWAAQCTGLERREVEHMCWVGILRRNAGPGRPDRRRGGLGNWVYQVTRSICTHVVAKVRTMRIKLPLAPAHNADWEMCTLVSERHQHRQLVGALGVLTRVERAHVRDVADQGWSPSSLVRPHQRAAVARFSDALLGGSL